MTTFFTIGHSTHPAAEFVALLHESGIELVADVRTIPRSHTNPQFNQDHLPADLAKQGIGYTHIAALGGRRSRQREVPEDVNAFWINRSFHNYADYALGKAFHAGLKELLRLGKKQRCAVMCAEAVWWRCHRRIITDYLLERGHEVVHIMGERQAMPAALNPAAVPDAAGDLRYPAERAPKKKTRKKTAAKVPARNVRAPTRAAVKAGVKKAGLKKAGRRKAASGSAAHPRARSKTPA